MEKKRNLDQKTKKHMEKKMQSAGPGRTDTKEQIEKEKKSIRKSKKTFQSVSSN